MAYDQPEEGEGYSYMTSDVVGVNCEKGAITDIKAKVPSI